MNTKTNDFLWLLKHPVALIITPLISSSSLFSFTAPQSLLMADKSHI